MKNKAGAGLDILSPAIDLVCSHPAKSGSGANVRYRGWQQQVEGTASPAGSVQSTMNSVGEKVGALQHRCRGLRTGDSSEGTDLIIFSRIYGDTAGCGSSQDSSEVGAVQPTTKSRRFMALLAAFEAALQEVS